jgi:RHS repeat-associated protein
MLMPRRSFSSASAYKFGFNGKENDNEVKGLGNQQDYGMRIYDGRVGRFLSVDPIRRQYPQLTPYQFASNRPIDGFDLDGLEFVGGTAAEAQAYGDAWIRKDQAEKGLSDKEINESSQLRHRTIASSSAMGLLIAIDFMVSRGKISSFIFMTQLAGIPEHNIAKTEEGRRLQKERENENIRSTFISYSVSRLIGSSFRLFGLITSEVRILFRGTTEGFPGSKAIQELGITPTSTDPAVATIFAIHAKQYGKGVVHIALPKDLKGVQFYEANALKGIENEVAVGLKPAEFASKASLTITVDQARKILGEIGIKLPAKISLDEISSYLKNTPKLSQAQIKEFLKRAEALNK